MKYDEILDAARLIADNQFYLAESLFRAVPPRSPGRRPAGDTTPTIEESLTEIARVIHDEVGLDYSVDFLRKMRLVAGWASVNGGVGTPTFRWVESTTWNAHVLAFEKGIAWEDFAAGERAQQVGRNIKSPDEREAIRQQAIADGTGPAKAVDIASNPKAMQAAIKASPKAAEAAREALAVSDYKEAVREAGGNPDLPPAEIEGVPSALSIEANRIRLSIRALAADIRRLHRRAEGDQWAAIVDMLAPNVESLRLSVEGITVPDTLEGIDL